MNNDVIKREFEGVQPELEVHLAKLMEIIKTTGTDPHTFEGNAFYYHQTFDRAEELVTKQMNLFACGLRSQSSSPGSDSLSFDDPSAAKTTHICEIGFNAGHSALLFILGALKKGKRNIKFTVFDLGEHVYTAPCLEYLRNTFPEVEFDYREGNSIIELPRWIGEKSPASYKAFDLVHVDGGHYPDCVVSDIHNALYIVKRKGILIIDDTNNPFIDSQADALSTHAACREIHMFPTSLYSHRIFESEE